MDVMVKSKFGEMMNYNKINKFLNKKVRDRGIDLAVGRTVFL